MTDSQESLDSAGITTLINHVFELWVSPELAARGPGLTRADIRKVLVELEPGHAPRVVINEAVELLATIVATRAIAKGEAVTLGDIESITDLQPAAVGSNSGWLCFARVGPHEVVAFDFTYNRELASALVARAREFLATARQAASAAVAVDTAHSAAELAVQAQMLTMHLETRRHQERRE